jgi:hypothetical protein
MSFRWICGSFLGLSGATGFFLVPSFLWFAVGNQRSRHHPLLHSMRILTPVGADRLTDRKFTVKRRFYAIADQDCIVLDV